MGMTKLLNFLFLPIFVTCLGVSLKVLAQEDLEEISGYRTKQYINLTLGLEQDVKLPALPDSVEFKGDFRRITTAAHSKQMNILRLTPKAEGFATLTIHDKKNGKLIAEYKIDVKKNTLDKVVKEIRALLGDIEGINIKVINNRVLVDGEVLLARDLSRILSVVKQFGDQADTIVRLSPLAKKKISEFIARDINNPEVRVRAVNDLFVLEGEVASEDEKQRAELIAKMYVPPTVVDFGEKVGDVKIPKASNNGVINLLIVKASAPAPPAKMVQLVVHFVELNKDYSKAFNFGWTPELSDQSQLTVQSGNGNGGVITSLTAVISNLLPRLNWAKEHGHARILESTSLIVQDGKKGEIKQMTNQPYSVIGKEGQVGTAFAEIGIRSVITPVLTGENSNSVHMEMEFSLSSLLGTGQNGAPITSASTINTSVVVRDKQSAAVGGLIRNSTFTDYNRLPANVKNPIISLYASKNFQRKQSQFVVFVTPVIKASASQGVEQIKKKFRLQE